MRQGRPSEGSSPHDRCVSAGGARLGAAEGTLAAALLARDRNALEHVTRRLIKPRPDNFIHRPWGGDALVRYKGLDASRVRCAESAPWGECFEIAADDDDDEARAHPSLVPLADGSCLPLIQLLEAAGDAVVGSRLVEAYGVRVPILPKTLDIAQLLSVQAHPPGFTEAYVIIEADPGATLRLGFSRDLAADDLRRQLLRGREQQQALRALFAGALDEAQLQQQLGPFLADRASRVDALVARLAPQIVASSRPSELERLLAALRALYWEVLGLLNPIEVRAGQVVYNANPEGAFEAPQRPRSAEVHALGNPEGKRVLALEVRRPAPTFRAWDHVRFPLREIDVERAIAAMNLTRTLPEAFVVEPRRVAGRPGVFRSVEDAVFLIDHLRPSVGRPVDQPAEEQMQTLHALRGQVQVLSQGGEARDTLRQGESALVPAGFGSYRVTSDDPDTELVQIRIRPA